MLMKRYKAGAGTLSSGILTALICADASAAVVIIGGTAICVGVCE